MGSSGGGGSVQYVQPYTEYAEAEEVVTPAVGKSISQDTERAKANQQERKSRLRGIRSTYSRFALNGSGASGGTNGSADKLG